MTSNFTFLTEHSPLLADLGATAEKIFPFDPASCVLKLRLLAESITQDVASRIGVRLLQPSQAELLRAVDQRLGLDAQVRQMFNLLRYRGNEAAHEADHRIGYREGLGVHAGTAENSGIAREALYKALRPGGEPRFETIRRVRVTWSVRLVAQSMHASSALTEFSAVPARIPINKTLHDLRSGELRLHEKSVMVVDEAGMVDSRQMAELVKKVDEAGAKLVLVGDSKQLQPIDAGGAMRALDERVGSVAMDQVGGPRRNRRKFRHRSRSPVQSSSTRRRTALRDDQARSRYLERALGGAVDACI